jgi:uncharacterized protein (DUF1778 family)
MVEDDKWMTYFGAKPEIMYVSEEAYDKLQEMIENPSPPSSKLTELLNRKTPWDETNG